MTCDRDRVYALAENPMLDDQSLETHLNDCPSCMELLGSVQEFAMALGASEVWGVAEPLMEASPEGVVLDRLVSESLRIEEERAAAESLVEELLQVPISRWHSHLRLIEGVCTSGLVETLLVNARARFSTAPKEFGEIADLAIEVAEALNPAGYPAGRVAHVRGLAWKDRANALRLQGRVQDALWSLDEAERHFRSQPIPEFDLAIVDYVRATVLVETDQLQMGLDLAKRSGEVFLEYGQEERHRHARMVEGGVLFNLGQPREAREIYLALLKPTQQANDTATLVMLFVNIGQCSVNLNDKDMASIYFLQAATVAEELGMTSEVISARWGLGRLLVSTGQLEDGIDRLRQAERELLKVGTEGDAALVSLEIAEALLAIGRPDEVPAICRRLVERFVRTGSQKRAVTALAFLKEAAETGTATTELVRHVRNYVEALPRQPELLFLPPPL